MQKGTEGGASGGLKKYRVLLGRTDTTGFIAHEAKWGGRGVKMETGVKKKKRPGMGGRGRRSFQKGKKKKNWAGGDLWRVTRKPTGKK